MISFLKSLHIRIPLQMECTDVIKVQQALLFSLLVGYAAVA